MRVATLKMSAPSRFFAKRRFGFQSCAGREWILKLWKERIRRTFCFRARASNALNARAERNSTSTYLAWGKNRRSNFPPFRQRDYWRHLLYRIAHSDDLFDRPSDKIDILRSS